MLNIANFLEDIGPPLFWNVIKVWFKLHRLIVGYKVWLIVFYIKFFKPLQMFQLRKNNYNFANSGYIQNGRKT